VPLCTKCERFWSPVPLGQPTCMRTRFA